MDLYRFIGIYWILCVFFPVDNDYLVFGDNCDINLYYNHGFVGYFPTT